MMLPAMSAASHALGQPSMSLECSAKAAGLKSRKAGQQSLRARRPRLCVDAGRLPGYELVHDERTCLPPSRLTGMGGLET